MKDLQNNEEADTGTGDQDDYMLAVARQQGGTKLARTMRRITDRISITRRKALVRIDGTMIPYEDYRDEMSARKRAAWAAVLASVIVIGGAVVTNHKGLFIWIGTALVAGGSAIIGKGVALVADASDWLEEVEAQQAKQQTKYVHEAALLRQLKTVYNVIGSPDLLSEVQANLAVELKAVEWKGNERYVISQSDSARLFLDSSRGARLGTPLVILGGILIALAS